MPDTWLGTGSRVVDRYSKITVSLNGELLFDASALAGAPGLASKPGSKSFHCSLRMHLFGSVSWALYFRSLDGLLGDLHEGRMFWQLPGVPSAIAAAISLVT